MVLARGMDGGDCCLLCGGSQKKTPRCDEELRSLSVWPCNRRLARAMKTAKVDENKNNRRSS